MQRSDQTQPERRNPGGSGDATSGTEATGGQDRLVGVVILVVGAFLFWETFSFKTVDWEALGLPFWPRVLLGLLGALGLYMVVKGSLDRGPFLALEPRAFLVLAGAFAYVLSIDLLGYLIATPVYVFAFHLTLGGVSPRRVVEAVILAALSTGVIYYVFQSALWVQFPEGVFFVEEL